MYRLECSHVSKKCKSANKYCHTNAFLLQLSPVLLRKKLRSPVPVLDLVHKFDLQNTSSAAPANNAPDSVAPACQMPKITERLMQNQLAKPHRQAHFQTKAYSIVLFY